LLTRRLEGNRSGCRNVRNQLAFAPHDGTNRFSFWSSVDFFAGNGSLRSGPGAAAGGGVAGLSGACQGRVPRARDGGKLAPRSRGCLLARGGEFEAGAGAGRALQFEREGGEPETAFAPGTLPQAPRDKTRGCRDQAPTMGMTKKRRQRFIRGRLPRSFQQWRCRSVFPEFRWRRAG